jgi:hypothetical protein
MNGQSPAGYPPNMQGFLPPQQPQFGYGQQRPMPPMGYQGGGGGGGGYPQQQQQQDMLATLLAARPSGAH